MTYAEGNGPHWLAALPLVSVVIPTRNRPALVSRALRSVLAQTLRSLEVIVVLDGPDEATASAVKSFEDARIRLITLPEPLGGAAARNAGVLAGCGKWIAFLDDDDEFLPTKLSKQWGAAEAQPDDSVLIASKAYVKGRGRDCIWPQRFPEESENLIDYLFCRRRLRQGDSFLQTSTLFVSRRLALAVSFREELARHQDWDWAIRLWRSGARIVGVNAPLTVYHAGTHGGSVSRKPGWQESLRWARAVVQPESKRAYAFFVATQCVPRLSAEDCRDWKTIRSLMTECFTAGTPNPMAALLFCCFYFGRLRQTWARRQFLEPTEAVSRA